ncbi:MAG: C25 family cysteine peptidase [Planctomycetota bacterium]|jgi:hypothetical protein
MIKGSHSVLAVCAAVTALAAATDQALADRTSITIPVGEYRISATPGGAEVTVEGFGSLLVPGKPKLPSRIFAIAIPPGAEVTGVTADAGEGVALPGRHAVPPAPLPRVISEQDPGLGAERLQMYERNRDTVYGSDDAYPGQVAQFVRRAGYRKYNLVDVRVTPFAYHPRSGQLVFHPQITIHVDYTLPDREVVVMQDNLQRAEQTARRIIINYDDAAAWYPQRSTAARGLHDLVIITTHSLSASVLPLVEWETSKGRSVEVVTTASIITGSTGYDLAEKMRNFLRDRYPGGKWGIEDVLIVGHYDNVPMRLTAQNIGYGRPETDYYYAELSQPDHRSWDVDSDHLWGEDTDPVDFYAEINVGRIPWSDPATVQAICEKTVAYDQNQDPAFKKNILLLGAFFWNDDPNPQTDTAYLMEAVAARPWMDTWTKTRMYEQNVDCYSSFPCDYPLLADNVMSVLPTGMYAFVNYAGHGSPVSSHNYGLGMPAFIHADWSWSLSDEYPAIMFADACSNSDTGYLNIGQAMIRHGAVGFLGATQEAYGCPAWDDPMDGSTQSLSYFFAGHVTSCEFTLGQAHRQALLDMYTYDLWSSTPLYELYEWGAIWGHPNLRLGDPGPPGCPADLNGDDVVGVGDFLLLLAAWGTPDGDIDGDGDTGVTDFLQLLSQWGPCP